MIILQVSASLLLLASKKTPRHDLVPLLSQLSVLPSVIIGHLAIYHNWTSWLGLIDPIIWLDLNISIILFDSILFILWSDLISIISLFWLNCFYWNCYSLHLPVEGGERHPQSHSGEYDWLGPDLMWNTQGWYIYIFLVAVVMVTPNRHNHYIVI